MKGRFAASQAPLLALVILVTSASLFPFYIMIIMGTQYSEDIFKGIVLLPGGHLLPNLHTVFSSGFLRYCLNSIYISTLAAGLAVFFSALAGFAFAKYTFAGKRVLFAFVLATMMIPNGLGIIAFVVEMRFFHWTNTHLPLFLPWIAFAFGVFLMTQYMKEGLPSEILESARMDGCSEPRIFLQFAFVFTKPVIATLSLLAFLSAWNNFLVPLIILNREQLFTLPLGIFTLGDMFRTDYGARILALAFGTIPLLALYLVGSRSYIRGLTVGAIKG